jgi:5-formyltetrahydrofolate cyclo-ligase
VTTINQRKHAIREQVWTLLEAAGVVEPGVTGYIPDFAGTDQAAQQFASLDVWHHAAVVKTGPDRAQQPVRERALYEGKLLYMAVPRLAAEQPFYVLDPHTLTVPLVKAADRTVAAGIAPTVNTDAMRPVDLVVCGSVAVNTHGARLGKGAGYSDIEIALLAEAGLRSQRTTIVTTVHDLQVIDDDLPVQAHDFRVDLIVTPSRIINCQPSPRPAGLDWDNLSLE